MQGEDRAGILSSQFQIDPFLFPEGLEIRFAAGGIGTHAKPRLQQVEGVFVRRTLLSLLACLLGQVGAAAKGLSVFVGAGGVRVVGSGVCFSVCTAF